MSRTSSKTPLWVRIHIGDYKADTADLSTVEHGALLLIRLHYWRQGPVRDDDATLARIAGLSPSEWKGIRPTLMRFFDVRGGEWASDQWSSEIADSYEAINKASRAGKVAAAARWGKTKGANALRRGYESHADRTAIALQPECAGNAITMLTSNKGGRPPEPPSPAKEKDGFQVGFEGDALASEAALGIGGKA